MQKEKVDSKEVLLKQISKIDEYFNKEEPIPYEEKRKTSLMIGMAAKIGEKDTIFNISRLDIKHKCYDTLQQSYRLLSKEASITLNNITDENLFILIGQFIILQNLEEYLEREKDIPLSILIKMNDRTVKGIGESAKVFKKINHMSVK